MKLGHVSNTTTFPLPLHNNLTSFVSRIEGFHCIIMTSIYCITIPQILCTAYSVRSATGIHHHSITGDVETERDVFTDLGGHDDAGGTGVDREVSCH